MPLWLPTVLDLFLGLVLLSVVLVYEYHQRMPGPMLIAILIYLVGPPLRRLAITMNRDRDAAAMLPNAKAALRIVRLAAVIGPGVLERIEADLTRQALALPPGDDHGER